jgi:hypothetical protein
LTATFHRETALGDLDSWKTTHEGSGESKKEVSHSKFIEAFTGDLKRAKNIYVNFEKAARIRRKLNDLSQSQDRR